MAKETGVSINIKKNLNDYMEFISFSRFYPDMFLDLIKPKDGGINLTSDQRVLMRAIVRFNSTYGVFSRGYGKCTSFDTMLFTTEGMKEIHSFFNVPKTNIETAQPIDITMVNKDGKLEASMVGIYDGYKPTKKIKTREMYEIECTHEHPLMIMNSSGEHEWKKAKDIQAGDFLCINRNNDVWGNKTKLDFDLTEFSKVKRNCQDLNYPGELTKDFAYYMGLIIGDGCITRDNKVMFTTIDDELLFFMENFYKTVIGKEKGSAKSGIDYSFYSIYYREYLRQLGFDLVNSHYKEIPQCVLDSTKENVAEFMRGLFDTDGTVDERVVSYTTVSEKLSKQIQLVLLNFGIVSRRVYKKTEKFYHYTLYISGENVDLFNQHIGFGLTRKQEKLESFLGKKRNTNVNIIPYQQSKVINFFDEARKLGIHNTKSFGDLWNVRAGENELSYDRAKRVLVDNPGMKDTSEYKALKELDNTNYFYSPIVSIEDSASFVYDVHMPETHSFVANGIVSHNTFTEVICMILIAIFYPRVHLSMTAQTKENAASILKEKYLEIIKFYPLLGNEVVSTKFSKNIAEIEFANGSVIDVLANAQSSKGQRRSRINVEESALLKNDLFEDAIEPIVEIPRMLPNGASDPCEMNQSINFFTTSYMRGSSAHEKNIKTYRDMLELDGKFAIGSSWMLSSRYQRGSTKDQILKKREDLNPISFAQNYMSRWVGASDGSLIDVMKLMDCRVISNPEFEAEDFSQYVLGCDVARSFKKGNNISSVAVIKIIRNEDLKIKELHLVNIYEISGNTNFDEQAAIVKKIQKKFNARAVCMDGNGLGVGLIEACGHVSYDLETGEKYPPWKTMNSDFTPSDQEGAETIIFDLKPQSANNAIIVNFIDMVEGGKFKMLIRKANEDYSIDNYDNQAEDVLPYVLTDLLIEEISNLKMKILSSGQLTVDRVYSKMGKDKFSALAYGLWYAKTFEDAEYIQDDLDDILGAIIF